MKKIKSKLYIYDISSMNVLDSFFWFQIQMLMLFAGALTLPLLNIGMLGCVAMDVALPYQTVLGRIGSGCLSLSFLSGMGSLMQAGSQKWSRGELVYEQSPAPSTHRASLWDRVEFSLERLSVSVHTQLLQGSALCSFHHSAAESLPQD
jgi:hypothetical protein